MTSLDAGTCLERLAGARVGRLATVTDRMTPHIVPCCFAVIDHTIYSAVDGKPKSSMALRRLDNVRANPAASLIVDHYADDWRELWWVRADGSAAEVGSTEERDAALAALAEKYQQYRADPPRGAVLRLGIEKLAGWSFA